MVYNVSVSEVSLLETHLTEWMQFYITSANSLPCRTVTLTPFISPAVLFVLPTGYFLMFLAVQTVCQLWAVRIGTRSFRLSWHGVHLLFLGIEKASAGFLPRRLLLFCFSIVIITHWFLTVNGTMLGICGHLRTFSKFFMPLYNLSEEQLCLMHCHASGEPSFRSHPSLLLSVSMSFYECSDSEAPSVRHGFQPCLSQCEYPL